MPSTNASSPAAFTCSTYGAVSMSSSAASASGRRDGPRRRDRRLVDAEPGHRPLGHQPLAPRAEDVGPVGRDRLPAEGPAGAERRLDHRRLPRDLPLPRRRVGAWPRRCRSSPARSPATTSRGWRPRCRPPTRPRRRPRPRPSARSRRAPRPPRRSRPRRPSSVNPTPERSPDASPSASRSAASAGSGPDASSTAEQAVSSSVSRAATARTRPGSVRDMGSFHHPPGGRWPAGSPGLSRQPAVEVDAVGPRERACPRRGRRRSRGRPPARSPRPRRRTPAAARRARRTAPRPRRRWPCVAVTVAPVSSGLTVGRVAGGVPGLVGVVALADRVGQPVEPLDVVADRVADEAAGRVGEAEAPGGRLRGGPRLSRSAVWLSRASSAGENQVPALQSSPLKIRG